jgi:hypothetical protein
MAPIVNMYIILNVSSVDMTSLSKASVFRLLDVLLLLNPPSPSQAKTTSRNYVSADHAFHGVRKLLSESVRLTIRQAPLSEAIKQGKVVSTIVTKLR